MARNKVAAWVLGTCLSSAAFAQEIIVEEPPGGSFHPRALGVFKTLELRTSAILAALTDIGGVTDQIRSDLYSTNTLLEETTTALDALGVTSGLLATEVSHDLLADVEGIEAQFEAYLDECDDAVYTCTGSTRRIEVDGSAAVFSCYPYRCGSHGECAETCASDADCSGGTHCSAGGSCVSYFAPQCDYAPGHDGETFWKSIVVDGAQQASDCAPFLCDQGACRTSCFVSSHCVSGTVCNTATGHCIYPSTTPSE